MNRRQLLRTSVSIASISVVGCLSNEEAEVERTELPELTARDVQPESARTTYEIRWNATAATWFDVDPNDARSSPSPDGEMWIVVAHATTNVGDASQSFDPYALSLHDDGRDEVYDVWKPTHLEQPVARTTDPSDSFREWISFLAPDDLRAAELVMSQRSYDDPVAVEFERDSSVELPM